MGRLHGVSQQRVLNAYEQGLWLLGNTTQVERAIGRALYQLDVTDVAREENCQRAGRIKPQNSRRSRYRAYLDRDQLFDLLFLRNLGEEEQQQEEEGLELSTE